MVKTEKIPETCSNIWLFFQFFSFTWLHFLNYIYIYMHIYIRVPGSRHPSPAMVITNPPILCFPSLLLVEWLGAGLIYKGETTVYGNPKKIWGYHMNGTIGGGGLRTANRDHIWCPTNKLPKARDKKTLNTVALFET